MKYKKEEEENNFSFYFRTLFENNCLFCTQSNLSQKSDKVKKVKSLIM